MKNAIGIVATVTVGLLSFAATGAAADAGTHAWRPKERWCGFNLLGMFCRTKMEQGDERIFGYIMDTERPGGQYEDFRGRRLERAALEVLRRHLRK